MNILVVHEVDYLKKVIFEFQVIPEMLAARGHRVLVLDFEEGTETSGFFSKSRRFEAVRRVSGSESSGITLIRPAQVHLPVLDRLTALWTHYRALRKLFAEEKVDAVLLYSAPTNGLALIRLAKQQNTPVIFRSIDILQHMRSPLTRPFVRWAEQLVYKSADRIAALTPALGRYTVRLGAKASSVLLLAPAVDLRMFQPGPKDPVFRRTLGIKPDARIVLYIGTFFSFSGLDYIAENFAQVLKKIPTAHLLLVGGGELCGKLEEICRSEGLREHMTLLDFRPFAEMPQFLREADLALNPFRPMPVTEEIIPSKILQYLACGIPTLSTPLKGTQELLAGKESGVIYSGLDDFPQQIADLLGQREQLQALSEAGRRTMMKNHSQVEQIDRIEELLFELHNSRAAGHHTSI